MRVQRNELFTNLVNIGKLHPKYISVFTTWIREQENQKSKWHLKKEGLHLHVFLRIGEGRSFPFKSQSDITSFECELPLELT